ncbi:HAD family hydrolase [Cellulomonas sp. Leaf334]|uniref:HAD family hydrolase n=1 Tax=Cellulomonas sp. Leaf334 TaxID=1736339 RepID=UPI0006F8ACD9|nr:HAD-IIB family hydrolase [Cellulomonas sp. Leaf334]KQR07740.1 hydrolase Cof [Cellulomonas sp. Leaf334]
MTDAPARALSAPRLVATDLDGTLLRPDGTVSPRTAAALLRAADAGVEVVFVTARPPRWLQDLASHVAGHGVAICLNGAAVLDVGTGRVLAERGMSSALVGRIADRIRTAWGGPDEVHLATESAGGFAHETRFRSLHPVPSGSPSADRIEDVLGTSTCKLLVRTARTPGQGYADALAAVVGDLAIVADSGAHGLGEISGPGITKATTLADWAASRGIDPADVWAVGDAPNDLSMLGWAGTSFAVANAHPDVAAAATRRCASNADDGVADVLDLAGALAEDVLGSSR